jgi:hypothetical protein
MMFISDQSDLISDWECARRLEINTDVYNQIYLFQVNGCSEIIRVYFWFKFNPYSIATEIKIEPAAMVVLTNNIGDFIKT